MQVIHRSTIFDAPQQDASRRTAFMDGLLRLESGTWLSGFTVGPEKNHPTGTLQLSRSRDAGHNWLLVPFGFETQVGGVQGCLSSGELVEVEPGRLLIFTTWFDRSDPSRPLFNPDTEGILRSRLLLAESTDEGDSWSPWREVPTPGLTGCAITGPIVQWSDGTIALTFESFKEFDDPTPVRPAAWLLRSRDNGATFSELFCIAQDPRNEIYYWDQRLCPLKTSGDFVAMFWTHDRASQRDRRVHFLRASCSDGKSSKSLPVETTIPGQIAAPLILEDGRILSFVVDRDRPGTMRLWQSSDNGLTWPAAESLVVHEHEEQAAVSQGLTDIDFAAFWVDMGRWSFGHPAIRHSGEGRVMVSWYAGTPDCMSVHAAEISV
jgi:hypothetical protein